MRIMRPVFRLFEKWVDPFREPASLRPPTSTLGFLWHYVGQARLAFVVMLVIGGLSPLVEAGLFYFVGRLVDILDQAPAERSWSSLIAADGGELLFMLLVVAVGRTIVVSLGALVDEQTITPGFYNLVRWQAHRHVSRQSYSFFQNDFAGRIATKVWQAGQATGDLMESFITVVWFMLVYTVTTLGVVANLDLRLAGLVLVWIAGFALIARRYLPSIRRNAEATAEAGSMINGRIVDSYSNIHTLKLFAADGDDSYVRDGFERYLAALRPFTRSLTGVRMALTALSGVMIAVIGWFAIDLWVTGAITVGAVAFTLSLVLRLNMLLGRLMMQMNGILRGLGVLENSKALISQPLGLTDEPDAAPLVVDGGEVRADNVSFHYGKGGGVLDNVDLVVRPGEKVGLVGPSGAGKTTLVNLILRLYDLESGKILIDGQDVARVSQDSLRANIGVVSQDTALFHRPLRDNIRLGRPEASEEEVIAAAKRAQAHDFIADLRDVKGRTGYDAYVGERGVKLSGGQRQRVAIARVFLKDAPILILDEATSALDSDIEAAIQENLQELMRGKTVIAIAHRLSTIAALDRLVVIDGGRIAEQGTHDELVRRGGIYARLWKRQSGGFLFEEEDALASGQAAE